MDAEYEAMFEKLPVAPIKVIEQFCKDKSGMPQGFFNSSKVKVVFKHDQRSLRPDILIIENTESSFDIVCENQEIVSDCTSEEAIFYYVFSHYVFGMTLPTNLKSKRQTFLSDFFDFKQ